MRKLFTFLVGAFVLAFAGLQGLNAQAYWDRILLEETFQELKGSWETSPLIIANQAGGTPNTTFGRNGGVALETDEFGLTYAYFTGGQSGNRGAELQFDPIAVDAMETGVVFVQFRINAFNTYTGDDGRSALFYLTGSSMEPILGLYLTGSAEEKSWHYWNMDIQGPKEEYTDDDGVTVERYPFNPAYSDGGGFQRTQWATGGCDGIVLAVDEINASTKTNVLFAENRWYIVTAELNFNTKEVVSLVITDEVDLSNTQTIGTFSFINTEVEDIHAIGVLHSRSRRSIDNWTECTGQGGNNAGTTDLFAGITTFSIYENVLSLGTSSVTVNYWDRDDQTAKASVIHADQEVTLTFNIPTSDRLSFTEGGYYYAFDAEMTDEKGNTSLVVDQDDTQNVINLYYKKSPAVASGTVFNWVGINGPVWDELTDNFSVAGSTENVSYQVGNPIVFGATDYIKDVNVTAEIDLKSADITIGGDGYKFYSEENSSGKLIGTGQINVNISDGEVSFGIRNELEGGIILNAGTLDLTVGNAATIVYVMDGDLKYSGTDAFSIPIQGLGGELNFKPVGEVTYTSNITGFDAVNYEIFSRGRARSSSNGWRYTPILNNTFDGEVVNVTTSLDTATFISTNNFTVLNLGDGVFYGSNIASADGNAAASIGQLNGTSKSGFIGSGLGRSYYYTIGNDKDSEFNGSIIQFDYDNWQGFTTSHINKVGTGTLTLGGAEIASGNIVVEEGTLKLAGNIVPRKKIESWDVDENGNKVTGEFGMVENPVYGTLDPISVTVNEGGSFIGAGGSIVGDIETQAGSKFGGNLKVTGEVIVAGDLQMNVKSFRAGQYDVLDIDGSLSLIGGQLNITANPLSADTYATLITGPYTDEFFLLPSSVTVNGTDISGNDESNITNGNYFWVDQEYNSAIFGTDIPAYSLVYIYDGESIENEIASEKEVESVEYYDLTGKKVTESAKGFVIAKTKYVDGTVENIKRFNK